MSKSPLSEQYSAFGTAFRVTGGYLIAVTTCYLRRGILAGFSVLVIDFVEANINFIFNFLH
jgi:hypothetical protein